jgi:hypothetical protein
VHPIVLKYLNQWLGDDAYKWEFKNDILIIFMKPGRSGSTICRNMKQYFNLTTYATGDILSFIQLELMYHVNPPSFSKWEYVGDS